MFESYDLSKKYIVACSGGPDSMALLNMLVSHNFNVIVAMVNYKTRKESDEEEQLVKDYCKSHNIKCYVEIFNEKCERNFEAVARKFRYNFFSKVYKLEDASGLFVAHHKDDVIETYLLKKHRNVINKSYLIESFTIINKMNVYRPLLNEFYKQDLIDYCEKNKIEYGIDKTNFMDIHTRNIIRKRIADMDKEVIYKQAIFEEEKLVNIRKEVQEFLKYYPVYLTNVLKEKDDMWLHIFLYESCNGKYKRNINKSILLALKDFLKSDKPNLNILVKDNYYLCKNYNKIEFVFINESEFNYVLNKLEYINTPYFKITNSGLKMHGIYVSEEDFPITIRNYNENDKIVLKEGSKKITRLFIDKKVPLHERKMVPVIENRHGQIIFVYNLYRKYGLKYVKNNLFMIK